MIIMQWYDEFINCELDGLEPLLKGFKTEQEFIEYFFSNVKFFNPSLVTQQSIILLENITKNEKIFVRHSMKSNKHFYYINENNIKGRSVKSFKNRDESQRFSNSNNIFHNDTNIKICIDKDGNYSVRNEIYKYTGFKVSQGAKSDIKNYVISHIWGNTEHPYFFTSLWNIALIPNFLSFILDKSDENCELARKLKIITKAICVLLYDPNKLIGKDIVQEKDLLNGLELAKIFINKRIIRYIESKTNHVEKY